eukprot:14953594-Heterocapsa_arctica.AAC.1
MSCWSSASQSQCSFDVRWLIRLFWRMSVTTPWVTSVSLKKPTRSATHSIFWLTIMYVPTYSATCDFSMKKQLEVVRPLLS